MSRIAWFLPIASLLLGCAPAPKPVAQPHSVAIGEIASGIVTVKPLALVEDSRCPADVQCFWAGRVVIRAQLWPQREARDVTLTLGEPHDAGNGFVITLSAVEPEPRSDREISPDGYRFRFESGAQITN